MAVAATKIPVGKRKQVSLVSCEEEGDYIFHQLTRSRLALFYRILLTRAAILPQAQSGEK